MEYLKKLMGDAFHEGVTVEEVNSFLAGKKLVDLNSGEYVSKEKYNTLDAKHKELENAHNSLKEQTKDYEAIKSKNAEYETEKASAKIKSTLAKYGVNESFYDYVKLDIDGKKLEIGDDDKVNKTNVEKYLKEHPQFASKMETPKKVVSITTSLGESKVDPDSVAEKHKTINDAIRGAVQKQ